MSLKPADRLKLLIAGVALLSGVAGAIVTGIFNYLIPGYVLDAKIVEISADILRSRTAFEPRPMQEWAIEQLKNRGGAKFSKEQREELLNPPQFRNLEGNRFVPSSNVSKNENLLLLKTRKITPTASNSTTE